MDCRAGYDNVTYRNSNYRTCKTSCNCVTTNGKFGSDSKVCDNTVYNSKYSNVAVIDSFKKLTNVEPVICRGIIQPAPIVHSNHNAIISLDTIVSDCCVSNYNIEILTCCENVQGESFQRHCCAYSHSITHQVNVLCIDSIANPIQCLFVYPAVGDTVQGFYVCDINGRSISRINNIPSGTLNVTFSGTVNVLSCNNNDQLDSHSAKIDFDNEIRARHKHGVSYTQMLHNIIDELTVDRVKDESNHSTNDMYSDFCNSYQVVDKDWTDENFGSLPNGLTAHIANSNESDTSKVHCDAAIPDKTVGFLNHTVGEFSFIGPDRAPVDITSVEQCFHRAEVIASTGCPNYAQARIPLASDLNIQEWEKELFDYPDKMLIEYLKFGFPLSLANPDNLHNTKVVNHNTKPFPSIW